MPRCCPTLDIIFRQVLLLYLSIDWSSSNNLIIRSFLNVSLKTRLKYKASPALPAYHHQINVILLKQQQKRVYKVDYYSITKKTLCPTSSEFLSLFVNFEDSLVEFAFYLENTSTRKLSVPSSLNTVEKILRFCRSTNYRARLHKNVPTQISQYTYGKK